jgi:hypothetical protein
MPSTPKRMAGKAGAAVAASSTADPPARTALRSRWALVIAVVLSATTLASAWAGFESTRWSGQSQQLNRSSSSTRFAAQRAADEADRQTTSDLQAFAVWLQAEVSGDDAVADAVRERMRLEFLPAFEAWLGDSSGADLPAGTPFDRPEYVLAAQTRADDLTAQADAQVAEADVATLNAEGYVLVAVLYASVLFLAGLANGLTNPRAVAFVAGLAVLAFLVATATMATYPATL